MTDPAVDPPLSHEPSAGGAPRALTPEAQRARAEADERRKQAALAAAAPRPRELGGRTGPDPVRYGDWETGGIASDF